MTTEDQQLAADNATEQTTEVDLLNTGETVTPEEVVETDEDKERKALEQAAEAERKKDERAQKGIQKRIDELTADKYAERKRADELAAQNAKILALLEERKTQAQTPTAPQRDQFDSYEDFLRAEARYEAKQEAEAATKRAIEEFQTNQKQQQTVQTHENERRSVEQKFSIRVAEVKKTLPDYQEVIEDWEPNLPPAVVNMIVRLPEGPLISYHLAKNPALEAQFLNESDPDMQKVLLGKVLSSLKVPAKTSAAPAPGKPVQAKAASNDGGYTGDPEGYYAWANKNLR